MRQGPHQKRGRGRGGNNNNRRPNVPNRNQTFDSNGPDIRIRGNAHQVYEKYLTLARDASTAGDRVHAESLFQHADHYFRIYSAYNEENEARRNTSQQDNGQNQDQPSRGDDDLDAGSHGSREGHSTQPSAPQAQSQSDEGAAPSRKTRSERRQDAEAAEQTEQPAEQPQQERPPRQPRRRRSPAAAQEAAAPAADDSALRAMLGASESGSPKAAAEAAPAASSEEPEAKPVRRRGRPRKVVEPVEQALPLAGED